VIKELTVNGATDCVIEFHGSVVKGMSMEGRMTLCNMAIEAGGTSGVCMPDEVTVDYLWPFISSEYKDKKSSLAEFKKWGSDEGCEYVKVLDIDVSDMEPQVTFGYKPDGEHYLGDGRPAGTRYIGSCTNGRLEDLSGSPVSQSDRTWCQGHCLPGDPKDQEADEKGLLKIMMRVLLLTDLRCLPLMSNGFCPARSAHQQLTGILTAEWGRAAWCT
jgi:3-isopropylmalate/(R)-2-methylmalate dehydratase large subunit